MSLLVQTELYSPSGSAIASARNLNQIFRFVGRGHLEAPLIGHRLSPLCARYGGFTSALHRLSTAP